MNWLTWLHHNFMWKSETILRGAGVPGQFDWCFPSPNAIALHWFQTYILSFIVFQN